MRGVNLRLTLIGAVLALALAGWAAWFVVRDRPVILRQLFGAGLVEVHLVVQGIVVGATTGAGSLFWYYVGTQLVLLPLAALWAFAERSRWSSVVLVIAAVTVAFLQYRLFQIGA